MSCSKKRYWSMGTFCRVILFSRSSPPKTDSSSKRLGILLEDTGTISNKMVHSFSTLQPQFFRILMALAAIFNCDRWTSDVRQAYLQSAKPLARAVYISNPEPEFELNPRHCVQLLKPLCGLCESGDLWYEVLEQHHCVDHSVLTQRFLLNG